MTIQHLVLSGGGPYGACYIGALQHLVQEHVINPKEIKSIHATSAGAIVALFFCLMGEKLNVVSDYILARPWSQLFKVDVWACYAHKGLFGRHHVHALFKSFFHCLGIPLDITFSQFYERVMPIELYFIAFDLNTFTSVILGMKTHGSMPILDAVMASIAIPGVICPVFYETQCLIDGGLTMNYPVQHVFDCFGDVKKEDILGLCIQNDLQTYMTVQQSDSIVKYMGTFVMNCIQYIAKITENRVALIHEIVFHVPALQFADLTEFVQCVEKREALILDGRQKGVEFCVSYASSITSSS